MDIKPSSLEDPRYANFAWGRYRKLMIWMVVASTVSVVLGLWLLRLLVGPLPWPMLLATAGGIFFSVLLAAALMGLVFLSSGTGHDEAVADPFDGEEEDGN